MPLEIANRPDKNEWLMYMAWLCSTRATCYRGRAGCVLTDQSGVILSTGYNGSSRHDEEHCIDRHGFEDSPCKSGCVAIHAEHNAIKHLHALSMHMVDAAYITCSPCEDCASRLAQLPNLKSVYYDHAHHRQEKADAGLFILYKAGIVALELPVGDPFEEHPLLRT